MIAPSSFSPSLPLKSVAGALLFSVLLGPLGLLYASVIGGSVMLFLFFLSVCGKLYSAAFVFWMVSCVWSVAATNHYNRKVIQTHNRF